MRAAIRSLAAAIALGGCETDSDQVAQATLFNGPASKIRACFGKPDRRIPVGVEQIWVYRHRPSACGGLAAGLRTPTSGRPFPRPPQTAKPASLSTATACAASPIPIPKAPRFRRARPARSPCASACRAAHKQPEFAERSPQRFRHLRGARATEVRRRVLDRDSSANPGRPASDAARPSSPLAPATAGTARSRRRRRTVRPRARADAR